MNLDELTARKDKLRKWLSIGGLAAIGLIVSPIIYLTIQGIVGLAIAGGVGFTLVSFAPWFALIITNARYRALESEKISHIQKVQASAAANPIETMRNLLRQKDVAFREFKLSVENAVTARDTFKAKCDKFAKKYPARALEFQKQHENMARMVDLKKTALLDARKSLDDGALKLEEMEAYWEMSKDAQELNKAAGMDTGDLFEKLKADTAVDAVFESMARAFAQLEVAASLDVNSSDNTAVDALQLTSSNAEVLDVPVQLVREPVRK